MTFIYLLIVCLVVFINCGILTPPFLLLNYLFLPLFLFHIFEILFLGQDLVEEINRKLFCMLPAFRISFNFSVNELYHSDEKAWFHNEAAL